MATTGRDDRSQPLFRVPRDQTPVTITLENGDRASAFLFVPPGDSVLRMLTNAVSPFMPVNYAETGTRLVARGAIACVNVHVIHANEDDDGLPRERQKTRVRLRGGHIINGELRWVAPYQGRRTLDHLNDESSHLVVHDNDTISYINKAHVASVEEL